MSLIKAGMLHAEPGSAASQQRIDVPLPVNAGAHEVTGYPNLKFPGLSWPEQERKHD